MSNENALLMVESPQVAKSAVKENFRPVEESEIKEDEHESSSLQNLDDRKCIRCLGNDLTSPGNCQFHPFQSLGASNEFIDNIYNRRLHLQ